MKTIDKIKTAQSNLKRSKLRTFLTILAVFIGTFTLAMTTALSQGVRQYLYVQLHAYGDTNSMIINKVGTTPGKEQRNIPLNSTDLNNILNTKNVTAAYPEYDISPDYLVYNGKTIDYNGISDAYPNMSYTLAAGSAPSSYDADQLIVPYDLLSKLNNDSPTQAVGKTIILHFTKNSGQALEKSFTISGVLPKTLHQTGMMIPYKAAENIYSSINGSTDGYKFIYATMPSNISTSSYNTLKSSIQNEGYIVNTVQDQINRFNQVTSLMQYGLGAFAGISLLVACICIINTLLMAVLERTKEIGLLKALGMTRTDIFSIFTLEAVSIGFWGGVLGVGIAMALGPILNSIIDKLIPNLEGYSLLAYPLNYMIGIILGAMIIGLVSGVAPAIRASKMNPIDALRTE